MGLCYGVAFFGINELVVTVPLRVGCGNSKAAIDELTTWKKIKEHCAIAKKPFWLVGSGISTVRFLEGMRGARAHYTTDD